MQHSSIYYALNPDEVKREGITQSDYRAIGQIMARIPPLGNLNKGNIAEAIGLIMVRIKSIVDNHQKYKRKKSKRNPVHTPT